MAISKRGSIDEFQNPAGPVIASAFNYVRGSAILAAGTVSDPVSGMPSTAQVFVTRRVAGGVLGDLRASYDGTNVIIVSANAGDTSTVDWFLVN